MIIIPFYKNFKSLEKNYREESISVETWEDRARVGLNI